MIKVFIITDLEGISGISRADQITQDSPDYAYSIGRLMADTNAAVAGAFDCCADEVLVVDGHGGGNNFPPDSLDPRAKQCRLSTKEVDFTTVSAFMHVGAHAMAGTLNAFLDHTQSSLRWFDYKVNGRSTGELGQAGIFAGRFNIPYIFAAGDEAACVEAHQFFGDVVTAPVKYAVGRNTAVCLDNDEAVALIRRRAAESISRIGKIRPYRPTMPFDLEFTYTRADYCDAVCANRSDVNRINARTIRRRQDTIVDYRDIM